MSSTWAEPLSSSLETSSAPRNFCCLTSSCFLPNSLGNLFFLPESKRNNFCCWTFKESYWPELWPGWKIIMIKTTFLQPYKQRSRDFRALLDSSRLAVSSIFRGVGPFSDQWTLQFAIPGAPANSDSGSWADPPLLNPRPLRGWKGILHEPVTEFKGTFSHI